MLRPVAPPLEEDKGENEKEEELPPFHFHNGRLGPFLYPRDKAYFGGDDSITPDMLRPLFPPEDKLQIEKEEEEMMAAIPSAAAGGEPRAPPRSLVVSTEMTRPVLTPFDKSQGEKGTITVDMLRPAMVPWEAGGDKKQAEIKQSNPPTAPSTTTTTEHAVDSIIMVTPPPGGLMISPEPQG